MVWSPCAWKCRGRDRGSLAGKRLGLKWTLTPEGQLKVLDQTVPEIHPPSELTASPVLPYVRDGRGWRVSGNPTDSVERLPCTQKWPPQPVCSRLSAAQLIVLTHTV